MLFLFPETDEFRTMLYPIPYRSFIGDVLVPEALLRFIQEDKQLSRDAALAVMHESSHFGTLVHAMDWEGEGWDKLTSLLFSLAEVIQPMD